MKRIIIVFIGILIAIQAYTQHKDFIRKAPVNPEYVKYLEAKRAGTLKSVTPDGFKLGFMPSPMYVHFKDGNSIGHSLKSTADLPTLYDLRAENLVTPPKNQGGGEFGGNCVAFATMGSIESRWLKMGFPTSDLSEQNTAACYGYVWDYGEGANQAMATAYLSRFDGPVTEAQDPYNTSSQVCSDLDPIAYVPESRWLPNVPEVIKKVVMDFGGVWASVHINYDDFDYTFNTYYYDGDDSPNHAWLVVGWDDFKLTIGGLGAWIIKNSWGDDWADNGYIYCSYNDARILSDAATFHTRWETTDVDHLYMYDKLGAVSSVGYGDPVGYGLAKFEAPEEQLVTKVGTFVNAQGTILDIEIYDDFDGEELTNLLSARYKIYVEYPGFFTFDIPTDVNGDFYIKVKYNTPGFIFPIPVETIITDYADPEIETDVNWVSSDAKNWFSSNPDPENDDDGENLTIRAYAVDKGGAKALFEANKETACLNSTVTFTFLENGPPSSFEWDFGEGASPATANTEGPHQVTYSTEGRKTVSLTVDGSDTRTRHQYIDVVTAIDVVIPQDTIQGPHGPEYEVTAFGGDTYTWTPSEFLDTDQGQTVVFDPDAAGTYTVYVEGTQGTCTDRDTLIFVLKVPPPNDNVCDAIELAPPPSNLNGVTNRNATVEFNEPYPPEGDGKCNEYGWWCLEGGLQNSIWYWFTAESDYVTFDGKGMDNQIAIYEAETCEDILNDNYTMITAFDDYEGRADYSFYMEANVVIGKKYFVQIDGSAGGDEGTFRLVYATWPLDVEDINAQRSVEVYPNPSDGTFTIKLKNTDLSPVLMQVYNLSGQLVYDSGHLPPGINAEINLDLSDQATGIYQVRVVQGDIVMHQKIIIQ